MAEEKPSYNVEYAKKYYKENRQKILDYQKNYYEKNNTHRKKRINKEDLTYKIKNKEYIISFK